MRTGPGNGNGRGFGFGVQGSGSDSDSGTPTAGRAKGDAMNTAVGNDRARGALLGLAVGDALGAPAENLRPSEIRRRWGRIEGFVSDDPAGTDDTEYAIFSGLLLARHGSALDVSHVERAWHHWIADLDEGPFRGPGSASAARWRTCAGAWPRRSRPSTGTPGATGSRCGRRPSGSSRRAAPPRRPDWSRWTAGSATRARGSTGARRWRPGWRRPWSARASPR